MPKNIQWRWSPRKPYLIKAEKLEVSTFQAKKIGVNDENPEFLTSNSQSKARFRVISQEFGGKSKKIGGSLTTRF